MSPDVIIENAGRTTDIAGGVAQTNDDDDDDDDEPPSHFVCPISFEVMRDPVTTPSGHSFERSVIAEVIRISQKDPFTREPLNEGHLRPNRALSDAIDAWRAEHGDASSKLRPD
jgi:U-box domain